MLPTMQGCQILPVSAITGRSSQNIHCAENTLFDNLLSVAVHHLYTRSLLHAQTAQLLSLRPVVPTLI